MCNHENLSYATSSDWETVCADCGEVIAGITDEQHKNGENKMKPYIKCSCGLQYTFAGPVNRLYTCPKCGKRKSPIRGKASALPNPATTLPYQWVADNQKVAEEVAKYLVWKLAHLEGEVFVDGLRVLHRTAIDGLNKERLLGFIDGLNAADCGVA